MNETLAREELDRAYQALSAAAASLSLAVGLSPSGRARADVAVLAEAVEAEIETLEAVMGRQRGWSD